MDLGVLSLLKITAFAGLTLLSYFKVNRLSSNRYRRKIINPDDPIITPIISEPHPITEKEPANTIKENNALISYDEFVSVYKGISFDSPMEEEWSDIDAGEKDLDKSDQYSTMGADTRRETISIPSEDFP
jgi:hypothetical protein